MRRSRALCLPLSAAGKLLVVSWLVAAFAQAAAAELFPFAENYSYRQFDFPGALATTPFGINNAGHIVGGFVSAPGTEQAFFFDGSFHAIDIPNATFSRAQGINESDTVVGAFRDSGGLLHGFIFKDGVVTPYDAPTRDARETELTSVTNDDRLIGTYHLPLDAHGMSRRVGFVDAGGQLTTINEFVNGGNDAGQLVGFYRPGTDDVRGFLFEDGAFTTVPPPGNVVGGASDINNVGQIVGEYDPEGRAGSNFPRVGYLYDGHTVVSLAFPGGGNVRNTALFGINDLGVGVGAYFPGNDAHGFIVSPAKLVTIDVSPGNDLNQINVSSNGQVPVAILSSPFFHATRVIDRSSLGFGRIGTETILTDCEERDVNGDTLPDLVCFARADETGLQTGDTVARMEGQTHDGAPIEGSDKVQIIGGQR